MPYEGEFAAYKPLQRISESERVKQLLSRAKVYTPPSHTECSLKPETAPITDAEIPKFIVAIDGSMQEVAVRTGYPGARVGYCTVASVLIDLEMVQELDKHRPASPQQFRQTEKAAAIDAAFPGCNVVTRRQKCSSVSFREELYDHFQGMLIDEEDKTPLIETFEALLVLKPAGAEQKCPYSEIENCNKQFAIKSGCNDCGCEKKLPIFSTDSLRIHERFNLLGTNGEAFGYVMQVWERVLLVHLLRCFEKRGMLDKATKLAFFLDGPLAVFGPPAWLSAAISKELKRLNAITKKQTGNDLIILGIEKSGEFVQHFEEIDKTEKPGVFLFLPRSQMLLTDEYIKQRIQQSTSQKRYGEDTYFGRKFFYKTRSGARIVASIAFLDDKQDTLESADIGLYPQFPTIFALLDQLVSSRYQNALSPIVSAHAQAAIPLHLGEKVLKQLAQALLQEK